MKKMLMWIGAVCAALLVATFASPESREMVPGALVVGGLLVVYFLPSFAASSRKHRAKEGIIALNLFLGWSLIGWVVAFVWAFSENNAKEAVR